MKKLIISTLMLAFCLMLSVTGASAGTITLYGAGGNMSGQRVYCNPPPPQNVCAKITTGVHPGYYADDLDVYDPSGLIVTWNGVVHFVSQDGPSEATVEFP